MAEQQKKPQKEQDINQLLKVRREKLANLIKINSKVLRDEEEKQIGCMRMAGKY